MNTHHTLKPIPNFEDIDSLDHRLWHRLERVQMLAGRYMRMEEGGRLSRGRDGARGQGRVLRALALVPEISQKDLTVLLDMRQQSLAELLAKLEAKGLVEREQDTEDRRRQIVRLTDEGRAAADEMEPDESGQSELALFNCLTDEEKKQLDALLARVTDTLEEAVSERMGQGPRHRGGRHDHGGCHGHDDRGEKGRRCARDGEQHSEEESGRRGHSGRGHRSEGGPGRRGRGARGGGQNGGDPRMKHRSQQFATLEGEPLGADDAAPACDHNCRQCPLRGTTSCIKRR
ncbi:MarR family winged helix-turn-helix transcriptional regulator [uncultured Adlercreutzia sp.]|uniref:MarR family winged helix-turn-helix transcriptional regulator n=1 Tax=uncultured Adlercreutzia sp. TaxID=875803 RepID=UPI002674453B|nr:MarR family transcriptional regulator [uncultured Adlercreutzia sp.]